MIKQPVTHPLVSRLFSNSKVIRLIHSDVKSNAAVASVQEKSAGHTTEWNNAKPYKSIPGPNALKIIMDLLPGGKFYKKQFPEISDELNKQYGNIVRFPTILQGKESIMLYDDKDIEMAFRTEGIWPSRGEVPTLVRYRKEYRQDFYKDNAGLMVEEDAKWGEFRSKVNPIMLMPKTVKRYITPVDEVAVDFLQRMKNIRESNNEMPESFFRELNRWALESIGTIGLDKRLGLIGSVQDPEAEQFIGSIRDFLLYSFDLEFKPSLWKYIDTPVWKKVIKAQDNITDFIAKHVDQAMKDNKQTTGTDTEESVLQKLLKIDRHAAIVMVSDMLFAGVDTTATYTAAVLYNLARNPDKQEKLREEVLRILPSKEMKLTSEAIANAPYLRACLKEALRLSPVTIGNARIAGQDVILNGYQIPKGTELILSMMYLQKNEKYYEQSQNFIPERWLKTKSECPVKLAKETNPFAFLPFGFGPRACIGKRFAELETEVLTIRILREFKLEWNHKPMEYTVGFVNSPKSPLKLTCIDI